MFLWEQIDPKQIAIDTSKEVSKKWLPRAVSVVSILLYFKQAIVFLLLQYFKNYEMKYKI